MPNQVNTYGSISPRTAASVAKKLLERGQALMVLERFGYFDPQPKKQGRTRKWRRYLSLPTAVAPIAEGITPQGQKLSYQDIVATLEQYGDLVWITDTVSENHEDPVLNEISKLLGEQAAEIVELIRYNRLKAGTNVFYANGVTSRTSVTSPATKSDFRKIFRLFKRNKAKPVTQIIKASSSVATEPVAPAYIALAHTDLNADLRALPGFVPVEKYSMSEKAMAGEIGKFEDFRIITTSLFTPWETSGASGTTYLSGGVEVSSAAQADVYPIICMGQDAYGIVPMQGSSAVKPAVMNPGTVTKDDPLGQRGFGSWKTDQACEILNQAWIARLEVTCTANPNS